MAQHPLIVVNFKTYPQSTGSGALRIAQACEMVSQMAEVPIWIVPTALDLSRLAKAVSIPVLAQTVDEHAQGQSTGWLPPELIKDAGAHGSLLNHSEHPLDYSVLKTLIPKLRTLGLVSIVCAHDSTIVKRLSVLQPDYIALEPPELIGGDISVSHARPDIIRHAVSALKGTQVKLLVGAGIKRGEDVSRALELGAVGVLVASGVVLAKEPEKVLMDLTNYSRFKYN